MTALAGPDLDNAVIELNEIGEKSGGKAIGLVSLDHTIPQD